MRQTYLGLGSNLDDPLRQVRQAIDALAQLEASAVTQVARFYRSKPWGVTDQADFLNTVVGLETELSLIELWNKLQLIEKSQNRVKQRQWGERTIDCDILLFGDIRLKSDQFTVPHLYLEEREFVLVPLAELAPELVLPSGQAILEKIATMDLRGLTLW